MKVPNHFRTLFFLHRTGEHIIGNSLFLQLLCQNLQHGSELGEDQHLMSSADSLSHQLHAGFQFGGSAAVILVDQSRIAAYLTKPHKLRQNLQFTRRISFRIQWLSQLIYSGIIQLPLLLLHSGINRDLILIRQLFENVILKPTQNKGTDHTAKPLRNPIIRILDDRPFKLLLELRITIEHSRH